MSTTPISSLLNITAPKAAASTAPSDGAKEFDRFLQKAATPVVVSEKREPEAAQPDSLPTSESVVTSEQEQTESSDDRGETDTAGEEQSVAPGEKADKTEQENDDQDEVILSELAVASAAAQTGEINESKASAEETVLAADLEGGDQKSEQPKTEPALEALPAKGANSEQQATEAESVFQRVIAESVSNKSQNPAAQTSDATTAEQAGQPVDQVSQVLEIPHETQAPTAAKVKSRLQGESAVQSESQQGEQPPTEKNKSEISVTVQRLATVLDGTTDNGQRTLDNVPSSSTAGSSPINGTVAQSVPQATQQATESPNPQFASEPAAPTIDRGRFVQRVANAFRSAQQNNGEIQLRLSPPELGSLKIEISVRNGVLTAKLETESVDARRALLDNLPALRQRLAEQDIRIDKFDVDVRRDGGQGQSSAEDRQSRDGSNRDDTAHRNRIPTRPEVTTSRISRSLLNQSADSLDVRI